MSPRSIRRAAERKANKQARKAERQAEKLQAAPAAVSSAPETSEAAPAEAPDFSVISPVQLLANRANAQLSTGPRTEAGKARSSKNAVKTALTGRTVLLPTDDVEEYRALIAKFQADLAPVSQFERELVQDLVDCTWRLRRIRALEYALYAHGHNQFENAFNELPEADRYNMILLQTYMTYEKQFRTFQIQEARIERLHSKKLNELLRLQAERRDQPEPEAEDDDNEMSLDKDLSPAELAQVEAMMERHFARRQAIQSPTLPQNGFDFSNSQSQPLSRALRAAQSETPNH